MSTDTYDNPGRPTIFPRGRENGSDQHRGVRTVVYLDDAWHDMLVKFVAAHGTNKSEVLRDALAGYLRNQGFAPTVM